MMTANDPHADGQKDDENTSGSGGGEDESSTEQEGKDSHLHDDQKSRSSETQPG